MTSYLDPGKAEVGRGTLRMFANEYFCTLDQLVWKINEQ